MELAHLRVPSKTLGITPPDSSQKAQRICANYKIAKIEVDSKVAPFSPSSGDSAQDPDLNFYLVLKHLTII